MSHLTAICRALDFVEDNLKQEVAVADMADAAGYSLYHFSRMFNRIVHHTPYDYLMRRRLSESARDMVETDRLIVDIAFEYRFNSPETYSRAFKRMFGMQPSRWKERGRLDERFLMSPVTRKHLMHINKGDYLRPTLEERDAFLMAGVMALVQNGQQVVPQLWEILTAELTHVEDMRRPREFYGLTWYPDDWEERGVFYMASVVVEALDVASSALVTKRIPPARYARFIHKGRRTELGLTRDYIYQTWLPKSGERLAHPLELEYYGQRVWTVDQRASEWMVFIPIRRTA